MREPKWLHMLTRLRPRIAEIIGRTSDPSVLQSVFCTLASGWRTSKGGVRRVMPGRSEAEIIRGLHLLRDSVLLAGRTNMEMPASTGIVVAESWRIRDAGNRWRWVARWQEQCRPNVSQWSELVVVTALADGKRSFVVAEPTGSVHGIISVSDSKELICNAMGYVITTNRHREVFLYDQDSQPVCYHNGSEWLHGSYVGPLLWVDHWAHYEKEKHLFEQVERGELPVRFPVCKDWKRWLAFDGLIEELSDARVPAMFAICDPASFRSSRIRTLLSSLRPELDSVKWRHIDGNTAVWANLFRLRGVHILSKQMRIMAVCQQVRVPTSRRHSEGTDGIAARFLSENLGTSGLVIEVSANGSVSVLYDGKKVNRWVRLSQ